jgi:ABC-2 type transport system ATP-binding protein
VTIAIRASGLTKTYPGKPPVEAVRGIDLVINKGVCFGLLGPNGAGKTTTMEMLEGLLDPTSGEIEVLSWKWGRDDVRIRSAIGISLQETRLAERMTVLETVRLFRSFYQTGIEPEEAIAAVSLDEKSGAYVERLSGGQKQRLAIAAAIVGDPEILFLDEPTTGLDPQSRRQLWDVIRQFQAKGTTIILTTHYMDEAERLCDQLSIVDHGQVIAQGPPSQLIRQYGGEHVVEFQFENNPDSIDLSVLETSDNVLRMTKADQSFLLSVHQPHLAITSLFDWCQKSGLSLSHLTTRQATLEDVFIALTGRNLRDDAS